MGRILVVDDDQDILKIAEVVLTDAGHSVVTAGDALRALELLQGADFDMVVSDANMPGYSGFDLVVTIRKTEKIKDIAVAMLTGRRERRDIERAMQSGVDDYIVKPIDPLLLQQKIASLFEKRPPREYHAVKLTGELSKGHLNVDLVVESVSELGIAVSSTVALKPGSVVNVDAEFFHEIEADETPPMKVLACDLDAASGRYRAQLIFLGAREVFLRKIRAWLNSHGASSRAT